MKSGFIGKDTPEFEKLNEALESCSSITGLGYGTAYVYIRFNCLLAIYIGLWSDGYEI